MSFKVEEIQSIIEPTISGLGHELVGVEMLTQGKHSVMRIYVENQNGINIGDIQRISRQISGLLDVELGVSDKYALEVSSPGMDRILFKPEHYQRFVESKIKVRLKCPTDGRRQFIGRLQKAESDTFELQTDEEVFNFDYQDVDKTQIIPEFN